MTTVVGGGAVVGATLDDSFAAVSRTADELVCGSLVEEVGSDGETTLDEDPTDAAVAAAGEASVSESERPQLAHNRETDATVAMMSDIRRRIRASGFVMTTSVVLAKVPR